MEIPQNILLGLVMSHWSQEWRDAVVFFQTKENWFALIEGGTAKKIPLVGFIAWEQRPYDLRGEAGHYYLASQGGFPDSAKYWQRSDQPIPEWDRVRHFYVSVEEAERYRSAIKVLKNILHKCGCVPHDRNAVGVPTKFVVGRAYSIGESVFFKDPDIVWP